MTTAPAFYVFMTRRSRHLVGVAQGLSDALKFGNAYSHYGDIVISMANGDNGKKYGRITALHDFLMANDAVYREAYHASHFMD